MKLKLSSIFLILSAALFFVSCEKELSYESGLIPGGGGSSSGTAEYTFNGGTGNCTGAIINGTYTAGTALSASNTVVLQINVTTIGTYAISSNTVNGMTFSGAGAFLNTGVQTVTLNGSGTPVTDGSYNLTAGATGCIFTVTVDPSGTTTQDFLKCNIDGVARTFNVNLIGTVPITTGFEIDGTESANANAAVLDIALANLLGTVTPGTYNLLSLSSPSAIFCLPIYDDGSDTWSGATNNQPGTFEVIVTARTANRIEGTFSGTIYDDDGAGPNAKVFTNGEFSVPY